MANVLSEPELFWLAGILEGDGSFTFAYSTCPRIQFCCCDKDVSERVASLIGGRISEGLTPKRDKKTYFTSKSTRSDLWYLLINLYPHMGDRRKQRISELLNYMFQNPKVGVRSQI